MPCEQKQSRGQAWYLDCCEEVCEQGPAECCHEVDKPNGQPATVFFHKPASKQGQILLLGPEYQVRHPQDSFPVFTSQRSK